jgi:hypothetical protein
MGLVFTTIKTGPNIQDSGLTTWKTARVERNGRMALFTRETSKRGASMVSAPTFGVMEAPIQADGQTTISMVRESMCGPMVALMMGAGPITSSTAKVPTFGRMAESMRANMWMIRKRATACITGQMEKDMKVSGETVNSMERDVLWMRKINRERVFGRMAIAYSGWIITAHWAGAAETAEAQIMGRYRGVGSKALTKTTTV